MRYSLLVLVLLLSGCTTYAHMALDYVGGKWRKEIVNYCAEPLYRREAIWSMVNGPLPEGMSLQINCPGDE